MDSEDLSWALMGGLIAWLLLRKPCPCEASKATGSSSSASSSGSSSGGGCVGGLPGCG